MGEVFDRVVALRPRRSDWPVGGGDLLAGLTVAVVALPLALAFGVASGLGAQAGLATAVVAGLVAAIFGGSNLQVSGPTGAMTVVLLPVVARFGPDGVLMVGAMAGVPLGGFALTGLGRLVSYLPMPVVEGFTVGIAVVIALQQVPAALGVPASGSEHVSRVAIDAVEAFARDPSLGSVAIATVVSFLAAYSFSRYKPRATNFLMFLMLSTRMVPAAASIISIFQMYNAFDVALKDMGIMTGSFFRARPGMFLLYAMFSIPFSLWILKGFIDGVSQRFDETGLVNGASRMHVIFRVVLPQVWPGIIAAFIFNLIFVWNEFLFNFILGGNGTQMIPYALAVGLVNAGGNIDWAFIASLSSAYVVLPMIMIYFFQRYLLVGMTFGTVRGEV